MVEAKKMMLSVELCYLPEFSSKQNKLSFVNETCSLRQYSVQISTVLALRHSSVTQHGHSIVQTLQFCSMSIFYQQLRVYMYSVLREILRENRVKKTISTEFSMLYHFANRCCQSVNRYSDNKITVSKQAVFYSVAYHCISITIGHYY